jgi:hypothetical protein
MNLLTLNLFILTYDVSDHLKYELKYSATLKQVLLT